jgi:hypothetical protein
MLFQVKFKLTTFLNIDFLKMDDLIIKRNEDSVLVRGFYCQKHGVSLGNQCIDCMLPHKRLIARRRAKHAQTKLSKLN